MQLEAQDCLVSLDVTNLFTQVDEALKVLEEQLSAKDTLTERTSIPVLQLTELIEVCLRTTHFQLDGAAIGFPLSTVVANLNMEHLEEIALRTAPDHMDRRSLTVLMTTSTRNIGTSSSLWSMRRRTS